tara:strand:+ start:20583 stop:21101 length:519 start_codon:yes stop_codon:yes gene_type:complete
LREEKKYLVDEIGNHLDKSDYFYLTDFDRVSVADTVELRWKLAEHSAEFHVIKNSAMAVVVRNRELPDISEWLKGQTAIVVGGEDPPGVAKALSRFRDEKEKVEVKGGILSGSVLQPGEVAQLADLPPMDSLKAQFLGLLQAPAQRLLSLLEAAPRGFLTVLSAKSEKKDTD